LVSASARDAAQSDYAYRFDWGIEGLDALAAGCDVIVVVDVLRFTTAVSAATDAGAMVFPSAWNDERAAGDAVERGATLTGLSPTDLLRLAPGTRLVLPSPNGSTISAAAAVRGVPFVLAGAIRNATATARRARALAHDGAIGVIAAGERWGHADGPLRPAVEDLLGAGAVLHGLDPSGAVANPRCSPEAAAARAAFIEAKPSLDDALLGCASGRELVGRGCEDDVRHAAHLDATGHAAQLIDGAFVAV
jgi:2-phosphosulfolactate phosphatase